MINVNSDINKKNKHFVEEIGKGIAEQCKPINPHPSSLVSNAIYDRILSGWFSEFNNGMAIVLMRVQSKRLHPETDVTKLSILIFLRKLLGHYKYASESAVEAIEFLMIFFQKSNVTDADRQRAEEAINQIYDGFELPRPAEVARVTAKALEEHRARMGQEVATVTIA